VIQVLSVVSDLAAQEGGVARSPHAGGFASGIALIRSSRNASAAALSAVHLSTEPR